MSRGKDIDGTLNSQDVANADSDETVQDQLVSLIKDGIIDVSDQEILGNNKSIRIASLDGDLASYFNSLEPGAGDDGADLSQETITPLDTLVTEDDVQGDDVEAETLSDIEPAAGNAAGGSAGTGSGSATTNGFGFQSQFDYTPLGGLDDIGPIDPTELNFDIGRLIEDTFPLIAVAGATPNAVVPDDRPIITQDDGAFLDETNFTNGVGRADGQILVDFGGDGPGRFGANNTIFADGSLSNGQLLSGGQVIDIVTTANGYQGVIDNGSSVVFTLDIDPLSGAYSYEQVRAFDHGDTDDANDLITLRFGVVATDSDGDSSQTAILISVADDGPVAIDDSAIVTDLSQPISGRVADNDDGGRDVDSYVAELSYNGVGYPIIEGAVSLIDTPHGRLEISSDGAYQFVASTSHSSSATERFSYVLRDADGDHDVAVLEIYIPAPNPVLIVGSNNDDVHGSTAPYAVSSGFGALEGQGGDDILVGDTGGSVLEAQTQDYNFLFILDTSGSMGALNRTDQVVSKLELLVDSVTSLLNDLNDYKSGDIQVHFVPFGTDAQAGESFTVTDNVELAAAQAYLEALPTSTFTNYEAGLQHGIDWLQNGDTIKGAETITYFISDGEPNRFIDKSGEVGNASPDTSMKEIDGTRDGSDEITLINQLSSDVIAVGIDIDSSIARLDAIDQNGDAINIDDPNDLNAALAQTNPLLRLASVGDDVIEGGRGNDIIFGDSVHTDDLAQDHGLDSQDGAGWDVFEDLEAGQSTLQSAWDRADTIRHIEDHAQELARESTDTEGESRVGGDDTLFGGAGDDVIFGQEGDDTIHGGAGDDVLSGGSGADRFMIEALNNGLDVIRDFSSGENDVLDLSGVIQNFDPTQQAIDDFIFTRSEAGGTILSIDANGSGDASQAVDIVALEGLQTVDIQSLVEGGNIHVV